MSEVTSNAGTEDKPTDLPPLASDPRRQACNSIRGYLYQIWVSVHAWLELRDQEVLYLEGAEDIDRLHTGGAEVIQVKDQASNVTLRSIAVVAAITNYWNLKQSNPRSTISFRFLTTSEAGIEQGEPFGKGTKGIDLWQQSRRDAIAAKSLVDFLVNYAALPEEVSAFLRASDIATVQRELLTPVTWETGAGDATFVATEVERKLVTLGESFGILPERSKKVTAALLRVALENASARERKPLTRQALLELFENETTERTTRDELHTLRMLQQQFAVGLVPATEGSKDIQLHTASRIQQTIPPMPAILHDRQPLVRNSCQILERTGFIVLLGSVGMGKTTLAKLIATRYGEWVWVHLSSLTPDMILNILQRLGHLIDTNPQIRNLLVDDIDFLPAACRLYEQSLGGILVTVHARSGRVILTSQRSPSRRLQSALSVQPESLLQVPALTEQEVCSMLDAAGCPRSQQERLQVAKIIKFQTGGHPQLVQAATRSQMLAGWPVARIEALLDMPEEVKAEKREARQILVDALSAPQRTLVYWLGTAGMFRRDHAIAIGQQAGIPSPGDDLDALVGPWVEPISETHFRVTPLIGAAANDAFSQEELRKVNAGIAEALLSCGGLTQYEASSIIMHAFVGKNAKILFLGVYKMIVGADDVTRDVVFKELSWFLAFAPEQGRLLYPEDPHLNSTLRMLQFRIALAVDASQAEAIAERWDQEIAKCEPRELYLLQRFTYVLHLLLFFQAPIRPARLIACFKELEQLDKTWPDFAEKLASIKWPSAGDCPVSESTDIATIFFGFTAFRCDSPQFLKELMIELETVPAELRKRMLSAVIASTSAATMLIDRAWLAVTRHQMPDWLACIDALREAQSKAIAMGLDILAHAATRGIAIVQDEYLNSPQHALEELDSVEANLGTSPIIEDERATILYRQKEYKRALDIWQKTLAKFDGKPSDYDITIWTMRKAAISAAMTGDWSLAAALFCRGGEKARRTEIGWAAVGLLADAAYAHWKAGEHRQLVEMLRKALEVLEKLPDARQDFSTFKLGKGIGSILVWIQNELRHERSPEHAEPYAGMCSNPEPNEQLRKLPMTLPEICWIMLADVEFELAVGTGVHSQVCLRFDNSSRAMSQVLLRSLQVSFSAKHDRYADILRQTFVLARTITQTRAAMSGGELEEVTIREEAFVDSLSAEETDMVSHTLATAIICASLRGNPAKAIKEWKTAITQDGRFKSLEAFLASAESTLELESPLARKSMRQADAGWQIQTMAALRLAIDEDTIPEDMFQAHVFLVGCVRVSALKREAANKLAQLIERNWQGFVKYPILLHTPMLTLPAIKQACDSPSTGVRKIGIILLAAIPAIRVPVPDFVIQDLERLRDLDRF